ncbi:MAG: anthranilate synthase component I family protein [Bacteroidia bacterium]
MHFQLYLRTSYMQSFNFNQRSAIFKHLSKEFNYVSRFESNKYNDTYGRYDWIIVAAHNALIHDYKVGKNAWEKLENTIERHNEAEFLTCLLAYDLKNCNEEISSTNADFTGFPDLCLWKPDVKIMMLRTGDLEVSGGLSINQIISISNEANGDSTENSSFEKEKSLTEEEYTSQFSKLKYHIERGDIYEVNYCREEKGIIKDLDPNSLFEKLNSWSPAPFACIHKADNHWLICSSPERFLHKQNNTITSQPIKGTTKRGENAEEDIQLQKELKENQKEKSENVMIVDLVRNDLSIYAARGSVQVKELCGIYPFATVSHMISTVQAELKDKKLGIQALAAAFPMGSMTGAPKLSAMKLIEEAEDFKRGIYSGATGYFLKNGDFDFNVVIRSFVWNSLNGHLSFSTGSAITIAAQADKEFQECELKAKALWKALQPN